MRNRALVVLTGLSLLLSACQSVPKDAALPSAGVDASGQGYRSDMIGNLLNVLPQLIDPWGATIQIGGLNNINADLEIAANKLAELGYALQRVDADQGSHYLTVRDLPANNTKASSTDDLTRIQIVVGDVELTRSYKLVRFAGDVSINGGVIPRQGQVIMPASPLLVGGSRKVVSLDEDAYKELSTIKNVESFSVKYSNVSVIAGGVPAISLITKEVVDSIADNATSASGIQALLSQSGSKENISASGATTLQSVLDNYVKLDRQTIIFPNDSFFLGTEGKLAVRKLVKRFSVSTDVLGIVGCSNGKTSLDIGNEGLALGRAKRVSEELLVNGVPSDRVFDEGCWSSSSDTNGFPSRGVVIDLWRRKS